MTIKNQITRRDYLKYGAAATLAGGYSPSSARGEKIGGTVRVKPKRVAAVITAYQKGLHADVLIGKILEGWKQEGGPGPALQLASMYVEQFTDRDLSRTMADKYNVPIFDTIEKAVTVGEDRIPVDGVISIGEHGSYPWNDRQQHLYPRRRFFEEITDTFEKYSHVVPVFSDKHLGPVWSDAEWMYKRAQKMQIPFMAGSSLPVTFRKPEVDVPMDCEIEAAVGVGYSGLDIYGSHTLDCFQCLVERRQGAETGVEWVQFLQGDAMWKAVDDGTVRKDLLDAALRVTPNQGDDSLRKGDSAALFLFQYTSGLTGAVLMLPSFARGISAALQIKSHPKPLATHFEEHRHPSHPHFAYLLKAIERMFHTGRPSYPVERTLLTSGILDRALTSRAEKHQKLATPELAIAYQPVEYPHAPNPELGSDPRGG